MTEAGIIAALKDEASSLRSEAENVEVMARDVFDTNHKRVLMSLATRIRGDALALEGLAVIYENYPK